MLAAPQGHVRRGSYTISEFLSVDAVGGGKNGVYPDARVVLPRKRHRVDEGRDVSRHISTAIRGEIPPSEGGKKGSASGVPA